MVSGFHAGARGVTVSLLTGLMAGGTSAEGLDGSLEPIVVPLPGTAPSIDDAAVPELLDDVGLTAFQDDGPPPDGGWNRRFTLAFSGSFGNSDTQSGNAGVDAYRETPEDRTDVDVRWYYGTDDGDESENRFTAGVRQDWFVPDSKWLYFAQARYDYDAFQSWNQRLGVHGGVGYHWIDRENYDLTLRAGAGVTKEWGSEDQELKPEGLLGADVIWRISDKQTFEFSTTVYPDLGDVGEYRWVNTAAWSVLVDEEANMSVSAGLYHEYQSEVDPGRDHNDLKVFAGLQFDF